MLGFDEPGMPSDLVSRIQHLEQLAGDLTSLSVGATPSAEFLEAAPRLDPYRVRRIKVPCLTGSVDMHPVLGGPKNIVTSPIWIVADDMTWVRTYSRFYRLGRPAAGAITVN